MKRTTFAENGTVTEREEMISLVPLDSFIGIIQGYAPVAKSGRLPFPINIMLRIPFLLLSSNYSDPTMEEALHFIPVYRWFTDLDSGASGLRDRSTIFRIVHFIEECGLTGGLPSTGHRNSAINPMGHLEKRSIFEVPSTRRNTEHVKKRAILFLFAQSSRFL